jgi:hypothetical protein
MLALGVGALAARASAIEVTGLAKYGFRGRVAMVREEVAGFTMTAEGYVEGPRRVAKLLTSDREGRIQIETWYYADHPATQTWVYTHDAEGRPTSWTLHNEYGHIIGWAVYSYSMEEGRSVQRRESWGQLSGTEMWTSTEWPCGDGTKTEWVSVDAGGRRSRHIMREDCAGNVLWALTYGPSGLSGRWERIRDRATGIRRARDHAPDGTLRVETTWAPQPDGGRIETDTIYNADRTVRYHRVRKVDLMGVFREMAEYNAWGELTEIERYENGYDREGNWVRQTTYRPSGTPGTSRLVPVEARYRTFVYYPDSTSAE